MTPRPRRVQRGLLNAVPDDCGPVGHSGRASWREPRYPRPMNRTPSASSEQPATGAPAGRDPSPARVTQLILCPRRVAVLLLAAGVGLVGWTIYLSDALPERQTAQHWDIAWIGLDVFMIIAIGATAWGAWKQRQIIIPASLAAAVLLIVDAWLDTMTASAGRDATVAYLMAALLEIPAAIFFAYIARHAFRVSIAPVRDVAFDETHLRDVPPATVPSARSTSRAPGGPIVPTDG